MARAKQNQLPMNDLANDLVNDLVDGLEAEKMTLAERLAALKFVRDRLDDLIDAAAKKAQRKSKRDRGKPRVITEQEEYAMLRSMSEG